MCKEKLHFLLNGDYQVRWWDVPGAKVLQFFDLCNTLSPWLKGKKSNVWNLNWYIV